MNDTKIVRYFLQRASEKYAGIPECQCYVLREGTEFGAKTYWMVYRSQREFHLHEIEQNLFEDFRQAALRKRKSMAPKSTVAPATDPTSEGSAEILRYYFKPPTKDKDQPQFYVMSRGGSFWLGNRSANHLHLTRIDARLFQSVKNYVMTRWNQLGIAHVIGDSRVESPDESWLLEECAPQARKADVKSSNLSWVWRQKFGRRKETE